MSAVVIAAPNLVPALREQLLAEGDLHIFADTDPIQALQSILEHRPPLIVLERLFAATPRGAALINRLKTDPLLAHSEVRVMSYTGDYVQQVARLTVSAVADEWSTEIPTQMSAPVHATASATVDPPRPLDWHGTRREPRFGVRGGVEIQLDGNPAAVVDVSTSGAQVVSGTILRPNQKVRVTIPNGDLIMRFRGTIVWAKFELSKAAAPPVYRAGVAFLDSDDAAMDRYAANVRL